MRWVIIAAAAEDIFGNIAWAFIFPFSNFLSAVAPRLKLNGRFKVKKNLRLQESNP